MRITIRLDKNLEQKIQYLLEIQKTTISKLIKSLIESYYESTCQQNNIAADVLYQSGFIACSEGSDDLSIN